MTNFLRFLLMMAALFGAGLPLALADETLDKFRESFEKRMNAELDAHGQSARTLRQNYLEALDRLKTELGKEEKLAAAAQVVAEIDAIENGDEAKPLPETADYRFKVVRKKWDAGLQEILAERSKKLSATVNLYFKALDDEKRKLTRAGKIKEALLFEAEEKRVAALPDVKSALDVPGPPEKGDFLETYLPGRVFSYSRAGAAELTLVFQDNGRATFYGYPDRVYHWKLKDERTVVLSNQDWPGDVELVFAVDGNSFQGKKNKVSAPPTGTLIPQEP